MKTIETEIWEPAPEKPGHVRYVGQRKAVDVFAELKEMLEKENLLPDEYFIINHNFNKKTDFPKMSFVKCYAQWGSNEGIYLDVEILVYNEKTHRYDSQVFATGKTLDESSEAYDRMQYIAGRIYKAFCGENGFCINPRYEIVPSDAIKTRERLIAKADSEFKSFIKGEMLHKEKNSSEIAEEIGLKALIVNALKTCDISEDKLKELFAMSNMLDRLYDICKPVISGDQFEIDDSLSSCRTFVD